MYCRGIQNSQIMGYLVEKMSFLELTIVLVGRMKNQEQFSLNFCGGSLNLEFWDNFHLTDFIENVNLAEFPNIYLQQDGALFYKSLIVSL